MALMEIFKVGSWYHSREKTREICAARLMLRLSCSCCGMIFESRRVSQGHFHFC